MKLFGYELSLSRRSVDMDSPQFRAWQHGEAMSYDGVAMSVTESEAYMHNPWVRRSVNKIAENACKSPMEVVRGPKKTVVPNHPLVLAMNQPNPLHDGATFRALMHASLNLFGECAAIPRRVGARVIQLWPIDPRKLTPIFDTKSVSIAGEPSDADLRVQLGWRVTFPSGRMIDMDMESVFFVKFPNPLNFYRGSSPLTAAGIAVAGDIAAARYNVATFANGAVPNGILSTDMPLQPVQIDMLTAEWDRKHRGIARAKRPAILHSGIKWMDTQYSNAEMEYRAMREWNREEILAAFGVPPVVVGIMKDASYANAREQVRLFWTSTVIPQLDMVASAMTQYFLRASGGNEQVRFSTANIPELQLDLPERMDNAEKAFRMGVPLNELIRAFQLPFEEQEYGNVGFVQFGLQRLEDAAKEPEPEPTPQLPSGEGQEPPQLEAPTERTLFPNYERVMRRFIPVETRAKKQTPLDVVLASLDVATDDISKTAQKFYARGLKVGSQQIGYLLGVKYDELHPEAVRFLQTKSIQIKDIDKVTREAVRETLVEGFENGETRAQLQLRVKGLYNFTEKRAKVIATQEIASAVNAGRYTVMSANGIPSHVWYSPVPATARPTHKAENRNVVKIGERFPVTNLLYPGDPSGAAKELVNCKCWSVPQTGEIRSFEDIEAEYRKLTSDESPWTKLERSFASVLKSRLYLQRSAILKAIGELEME